MLQWAFVLIVALGSSLLLPLHFNADLLRATTESQVNASRILLLTAHPDDECFFFAPTVLALRNDVSQPEIFSLCLSIGNAQGLGELRKEELTRSLDVMGIERDNRWVVDHPLLQDDIAMAWEASVIAKVVTPYIVDHNITAILTFDTQGISSHPNHCSLPHGASYLVQSLSQRTSGAANPPRVFGLITTPVLPKYVGFLSVFYARLKISLVTALSHLLREHSPSSAVFTSGFREYLIAARAVREHGSQMLWFRYLYMSFSRYMWVNEWVEIDPSTSIVETDN